MQNNNKVEVQIEISSNLITKEEVAKVAKLARISENPSDEFLEKYSKELSSIVTYINQLKEVDTSTIDVTTGVRTISVEELRDDTTLSGDDLEEYEDVRTRIIANFPSKSGNLLLLPGIFDN